MESVELVIMLLVTVVLLSWQARAAQKLVSVRSDGTDILLNTVAGEGEVTVDGKEYLIMTEDDILAVVG